MSIKSCFIIGLLHSVLLVQAQSNNPDKTDSLPVVGIPTGYAGERISMSPVRIRMEGQIFTNELSVLEFLQGRIAGLDITQPSGDAGKDGMASIRKQGLPLVIIDGLPQNNLDIWANLHNTLHEDIRSRIPVALSDIESIEVLKEGYATALYGTEGAYGVILIETKKGRAQKAQLTYQFNQSFYARPEYPQLFAGDQYVMCQLEAWHNSTDGIFEVPPELSYDRDFVDYYNYSANTDWVGAVTQPGNASTHYLSFTGGNNNNRIYGSVNYQHEKGTIINTGFKRFINRISFEHDFSKKLTAGIQVFNSYSRHDENPVYETYDGYATDILHTAFLRAPNVSIWEYDAEGNKTGAYFNPVNDYQGRFYNPVAMSDLGKATNKVQQVNATALMGYKWNDWLQIKESFSVATSSIKSDACFPTEIVFEWLDWIDSDTSANSYVNTTRLRNELQSHFHLPVQNENKHAFDGYATWILQNNKMDFSEEDELIAVNGNKMMMNAAVLSLQYGFLKRYFITANSRSEHFKNDDLKTWDHHVGVSAGWKFTAERFMKPTGFLNSGMMHAGWSYSDGHPFSGYYSYSWSNTQQWQKTYNIGTNLSFFNDHIHLDAGWYKKEFSTTYPESEPMLRNPVKYHYAGIELATDARIDLNTNLSVVFNFNIHYLKQKPVKEPEFGMLLPGLDLPQPFGSIFALDYEGIYQSDDETMARDANGNILLDEYDQPVTMSYLNYYYFEAGDVKYRDVDHNGTINGNDLVYQGSSVPKYTGGFGSTIRFKSLAFTCNFHYRSGYQIQDVFSQGFESPDDRDNKSVTVLRRWRMVGSGGNYPRAYMGHPANALPSSRYVKPGNFVRLNYVNLSYSVNPAICKKMYVTGLTVSASAQRLFTMTGYDGLDPEIETNYGPETLNYDLIRPLPLKVFTFGLQVTL